MRPAWKSLGLLLLAALVAVAAGIAAFVTLGALLSQWLPLSLFQASALAIGGTLVMVMIAILIAIIMHDQMEHAYQDDDSTWDFEDDEPKIPLSAILRLITPKIGRNAPCPCGSGRKFKNCCGIPEPKD